MRLVPDMSRLRRANLLVAAPMFGGQCHGAFTTAMLKLATLFSFHKLDIHFQWWYEESLVPRARNRIAHIFLYGHKPGKPPYTHLLFKDADHAFIPEDVLNMLALDLPIVGSLYPKKAINWERVRKAIAAGVPNDKLMAVASDPVCNFLTPSLRLDEPVEVKQLGTGSMMIRRDVLEMMVDSLPDIAYDATEEEKHLLLPASKGCFHDFFGCGPDPSKKLGDGRYYLSEDFFFCDRARQLGYKVWLCPWMSSSHYGTCEYQSDLEVTLQYKLEL